jgi:L-serine dehydratase
MAAAALTELGGGTPEQVGHAVALCLTNMLGLVCDPVAGLVEIPCILRNAGAIMQALLAAELALADIKSRIPADEVIAAMREVGEALPESLRETAKGGLANTPTGKRLRSRLP